jgi:hypothetical protein
VDSSTTRIGDDRFSNRMRTEPGHPNHELLISNGPQHIGDVPERFYRSNNRMLGFTLFR